MSSAAGNPARVGVTRQRICILPINLCNLSAHLSSIQDQRGKKTKRKENNRANTSPSERAADGKSYVNPPAEKKSSAYTAFPAPITNGIRGGFDVHIYFLQSDPSQVQYATELWERIRRECTCLLRFAHLPAFPPPLTVCIVPELRIYRLWDRPIGPHYTAMFEVNLFTPEQFGAFIPWLVIWRGPLSALVHPNTGRDVRDHSQLAGWLGQPLPINLGPLRKSEEAEAERKKKTNGDAKV